MTTEKKLYLVNGGSVILASLVFVFAILNSRAERQVTAATENRDLCLQLVTELRESFDDLTCLARTYVVTGDDRYEKEYRAVMAVRSGEKPRSDGRSVALRQLMQEAGFESAEFAKLKEVEEHSSALAATETVAMNAVKGLYDDGSGQYVRKANPDREMALRILHDAKYHQNKAIVLKTVGEFEELMNARTKASVATFVRRESILSWLTETSLPVLPIFPVISLLIIRLQISRPLKRVVTTLSAGANGISDAAGRMSASSQSLAEGSSAQAASLEETSASLEEMSSMTKRNADNAQSAKDLANQTRAAADASWVNMQNLGEAMTEIQNSSDGISKIIKTIDQIAFQTNILALNAAVEAARAGEAGMGFAVVADEVRSLAQRSAQAAKETAAKIEGSIAKTALGVEMTRKVTESLQAILMGARKLDDVVASVATASEEQNQGVSQINNAVAQMDKITQSTAATAEQTASASRELYVEAKAVTAAVQELWILVGNSADQSALPEKSGAERQSAEERGPAVKTATATAPEHSYVSPASTAGSRAALTTDKAIPMAGNFKDF